MPSPLVCEPEPLGLGKVAGGAPESLARSERAVRGPLAFGSPLAREGLSAEAPSGANLGRGVSASFAEGAP